MPSHAHGKTPLHDIQLQILTQLNTTCTCKVSHIGGDKGWWRAAKTRLSSIFVQHFRFGLRLYLCQKDPKGVIVVVVVALIGWLILVSSTRSFPLSGW